MQGSTIREDAFLDTPDQIDKFLQYQIQLVREARAACNVAVPGDTQATKQEQRRAFLVYMQTYGSALGAIRTLRLTRKLSGSMHDLLLNQLNATAVPTIVGKR